MQLLFMGSCAVACGALIWLNARIQRSGRLPLMGVPIAFFLVTGLIVQLLLGVKEEYLLGILGALSATGGALLALGIDARLEKQIEDIKRHGATGT
jgi:hypothetical protein